MGPARRGDAADAGFDTEPQALPQKFSEFFAAEFCIREPEN
jgi:hypothetical protein